MRFGHPQILWLLLLLPGLALFLWHSNRRRQMLLAQFIELRLLGTLTVGISHTRRKVTFALLIAAVGLLIIALARPQYGFDLETVEQRGVDIVVAVDTSKSMLATDVTPNRLARAKLAALDLMQHAKTDRLGLVAFAGEAFLECPLTTDDTAFRQSVEALDVNTIPLGGTAFAPAINAALTAFKERDTYKVMVLITDGEDNVGGALEAAKAAAKTGLKIYTVGVGTAEGTLLQITDANGNSDYIRDPDGNVVKSHLDEALLRQIAGATGGFYLPLRPNTIDELYAKGIAPLPQSESQERLVRRYHEQFAWPLAAAILLLLAEMFLPERKRERSGETAFNNSGGAHTGLKSHEAVSRAAMIVVAALFLWPVAGIASPASALRDYRTGNYTNALEEFAHLAGSRTNDLRLVFDAGDAAYRATNFDLARNLFRQATLAPDLTLQEKAYYNLGNAQFRLAQDAKDLDGLQAGLEEAEKSYDRAVTLVTNDPDAMFNFAFTRNVVEQIKELRETLRRMKSEADAAVRQAEFHRALEIMLPLQKSIAAKQFQDFTKRLKDIDDIDAPATPLR
ncbi:MAG: VWA domain-containing protein [Verrucomicrobiota bacterium]|jgi:Ca-activated chloride channel family protein